MSIHALSENIAMRNVADQLQARMLALQDENTNIPEVTPRERERERETVELRTLSVATHGRGVTGKREL